MTCFTEFRPAAKFLEHSMSRVLTSEAYRVLMTCIRLSLCFDIDKGQLRICCYILLLSFLYNPTYDTKLCTKHIRSSSGFKKYDF